MKEIYEKCVLCGRLTSVLKSVPVGKRQGYIEGAGQLCSNCFREFKASSRAFNVTAGVSEIIKNSRQ
ncbi:MAG: hypothetical protein KBS52_03000 [Clostridiales bacterium]|nr:hypothetical protein [Candidatus Equinaster intestinalis]